MRRLIKNGFLSLFTIGSCVATYMAFEKLYKEKENRFSQRMDNKIEIIDEDEIDDTID